MSRGDRYVSSILLAVALFSPVVFSGCAVRASYRVYDPSYEDYHVWDSSKVVYYQRWELETHRDHRDFRKRHADEQKEYWTWRHNHHDDRRQETRDRLAKAINHDSSEKLFEDLPLGE